MRSLTAVICSVGDIVGQVPGHSVSPRPKRIAPAPATYGAAILVPLQGWGGSSPNQYEI